MSSRQNNEENIPSGDVEKSPRTQLEKLRLELKAASARARTEEKARLKLEEALAQAQADAQEAQADAEQERQLRLQAELALSEAQKKPVAEPPTTGAGGAESRLVFILRLSLDENRQPKRVEIEENQTRKKESFQGLDPERVMAFIKAFLPPPAMGEARIPAQVPGPEIKTDKIGQQVKIVVSQVELVTPFDDFNRLVVAPGESALIRIRYSVDDPQALAEIEANQAFDIKVYTRSVQDNAHQLLSTHQQAVLPGVPQYSAELVLSDLAPGDYNLFTVVSLPSARLAGFSDGPVLEVRNPRSQEILWPEDRTEQLTSPN